MIRHQLFIGFALLAGVAVGYFMRESREGTSAPAAPAAPVAKGGRIADAGDAANVKALRRRVAELERLLAEKRAAEASVVETPVTNATAGAAPERPRGNPREWLEQLKTSDPARYAQMTNRFANWRRQRAERTRSTLEFLSSIDTSHMSKKAKRTHAALQEMIARREEIEQQVHREDISDEDRRRLFDEMRQTHGEMMRLNGEERKNLIAETAKTLGFEGEDVKTISDTIMEVIRATDGGFGGGPRGGRGNPPPPPPR